MTNSIHFVSNPFTNIQFEEQLEKVYLGFFRFL